LICYGSEQAAVKAALNYKVPGISQVFSEKSHLEIDEDVLRLDLDDLGGEIVLLDWGKTSFVTPAVSKPYRYLMEYELMNGYVHVILFQESKATKQFSTIYHRMTRLSRNELIKPLEDEPSDLILSDIQGIPKLCADLQEDWISAVGATSLNRLTAFNLSQCLRERLKAHVSGTVRPRSVDIVLTGCEVSLWLAEQFASDLQKSFPLLNVIAVSSNKLLGLYGQDILVPACGFPYSGDAQYIHDAIMIIVSHSGGTFAPLSCSNLLQSASRNIFAVASEWDTQIGKQLRKMDENDSILSILGNSRIFSTEAGIRPAEPCSISVAATHQLLTNLFGYISVLILSDDRFRKVSGAVITEQDLEILEKCNRMNIEALTEIVGTNRKGLAFDSGKKIAETELRKIGDIWADHILENVKAYIMTFVYIFVTVVSGFPIFTAIARAASLDRNNDWIYLGMICLSIAENIC
jgi:hypothetical protein